MLTGTLGGEFAFLRRTIRTAEHPAHDFEGLLQLKSTASSAHLPRLHAVLGWRS